MPEKDTWPRGEPGRLADKQRNYRNQIDAAKQLLVAKMTGIIEHSRDEHNVRHFVDALSDFILMHEPKE